jgi:beta-lactamase superfamily II metal-dependent hydrolase
VADKLPEQGITFWPVGTGDSTTISVSKDVFIQVDIRQLAASEDDEDPRTPVVDRLIGVLPKKDGKPYLAVFVLTHPDKDHCLGFADLLKKTRIGEIWMTPRVFDEYHADLCDDASAFKKEAERRAKLMIEKQGAVASGDRLRIVGWTDTLKSDPYIGFPESALSVPGHEITVLDGVDYQDSFRAFIHAPFKDDAESERNDTSLGMQVTLSQGEYRCRVLLLGDLSYPIVKRIFELSDAEDLRWDIFLAPHHCSKSVMYWKDDGEEEETLRQDVLDVIESAAESDGVIVASCDPVPASNKDGDNPPHSIAKARYEEIAEFLCTGDQDGDAITFTLGTGGLERGQASLGKDTGAALAGAVSAARGSTQPPKERVGFGHSA